MVEIIYEVDKDDKIIGKRPKPDFKNSEYIHRASHLLVFNRKGEMLIQLRVKDKPLYPGVWDTAVGGTVAEESYEECIEREMQEEIGISVKYRHLFHYTWFDSVDKSHKEVYSAVHDGPFTMQESEVADLKWINLKELYDWMEKEPDKFCPPFLECMRIYFQKYSFQHQNDSDRYLVTEVDKDDNVIGPRHILEFFDTDYIHRGSAVIVFNTKGEILLQHRSKTKQLFPNVWDFSAAGFVDEGESYETAAIREAEEELGTKLEVRKMFHFLWNSKNDKAHTDVFKAVSDGPFNSNEEVDGLKWISLDCLRKEIEDNPGDFSAPFVAAMNIFFNR